MNASEFRGRVHAQNENVVQCTNRKRIGFEGSKTERSTEDATLKKSAFATKLREGHNTNRSRSEVRRWILEAERRAHRVLQKFKYFRTESFFQVRRHRRGVERGELDFLHHKLLRVGDNQVERNRVQQGALAAQHVSLQLRELVVG